MDRRICTVVGAVAGGTTGGAISNDNDNDHYDINWSIAGGALAGAAVGYLLCGERAPKQSPTARVSAEPSSGPAPLDTTLRGVGHDADGQVVSYAWDLGDGTRATGQEVRHTYRSVGDYRATLTVTDNDGLTGSASTTVRATGAEAPAAVKRRIVLRGVNFAFDSAELTPEAQVILDAAVEALRESPSSRLEVAGHTDHTGTDEYNQGLSERRARAVASYLAQHGIDENRMTVVGYGESRPVADNATRDGRAQNRRTELNVLD